MFLKKIRNLTRTLAFRLSFWYAAIFTASSFIAFLFFYVIMSSAVLARTDRELLQDLSEIISIQKLRGKASLETEIQIEAEADGIERIFFRLLDFRGKEVASSNMSLWEGMGVGRTALKRLKAGEGHVFETYSLRGRKYNVRIVYGTVGRDAVLQIGKSLEDDAKLLEVFREIFGISMVIIMILSALIGWIMARHALSGVEEVTETALEISKGAFEARVNVGKRDDEIIRLASAFNRMLDRIHDLMTGMREMTDHIAHDLKTPITRIRGLAESGLNEAQASGGTLELAADTIEECDYLLQMINTLLEISETEAGARRPVMKKVNLSSAIYDACELFRPIAEDKGITLISEGSDPIYVNGDIRGLRRMVVNLLENAVKYTSQGGSVTVSLREEDGQIILSFRDTGVGISENDLPNLFKRFYRCEPSRSQPGFGLGLSLAVTVARAHGGDIRAVSRTGEGSLFEVRLPLFSADA